jgi:hypothetical protein
MNVAAVAYRHIVRTVIAAAAVIGMMVAHSRADERPVEDVTIWWSPWYRRDPGPIMLFVNGVLVGADRDGMEAVLEVVRKLPQETSVVWGPDCAKSWTASRFKSTVPEAFPDLWGQFRDVARANGLILSSGFYGGYSAPWVSSVAKVVPAGGPRGRDDVLIRWEFIPPKSLEIFIGEKSVGRDAEGVLAVKKVLETVHGDQTIRFVLAKNRGQDLNEVLSWDALVDYTFESTLAGVIERRNLRAIIETPEEFMLATEKAARHVRFDWRNYDYFRETPHERVIYLIDGKVMGIGDPGMDAVLAFLRKQQEGTLLTIPQFSTSKFVQDVDKDRVPFSSRRNEFQEIVKSRRIEIDYAWTVPMSNFKADAIHPFLSLGHLVRDGETPKNADMILSWKDYAATDLDADPEPDPEEAIYTLDNRDVGKGMAGFLAALRQIEALPKAAVLRLDPVCIRTKGPFPCPIMLAGHRHFARTGREPYLSLVELLVDVVAQRALKVELIPDEAKAEFSCIAK